MFANATPNLFTRYFLFSLFSKTTHIKNYTILLIFLQIYEDETNQMQLK